MIDYRRKGTKEKKAKYNGYMATQESVGKCGCGRFGRITITRYRPGGFPHVACAVCRWSIDRRVKAGLIKINGEN
ncbi:MAG: hypothetical protein GY757_09990 [bacterium]|nr:hypothetical protein [bacterium]